MNSYDEAGCSLVDKSVYAVYCSNLSLNHIEGLEFIINFESSVNPVII